MAATCVSGPSPGRSSWWRGRCRCPTGARRRGSRPCRPRWPGRPGVPATPSTMTASQPAYFSSAPKWPPMWPLATRSIGYDGREDRRDRGAAAAGRAGAGERPDREDDLVGRVEGAGARGDLVPEHLVADAGAAEDVLEPRDRVLDGDLARRQVHAQRLAGPAAVVGTSSSPSHGRDSRAPAYFRVAVGAMAHDAAAAAASGRPRRRGARGPRRSDRARRRSGARRSGRRRRTRARRRTASTWWPSRASASNAIISHGQACAQNRQPVHRATSTIRAFVLGSRTMARARAGGLARHRVRALQAGVGDDRGSCRTRRCRGRRPPAGRAGRSCSCATTLTRASDGCARPSLNSVQASSHRPQPVQRVVSATSMPSAFSRITSGAPTSVRPRATSPEHETVAAAP